MAIEQTGTNNAGYPEYRRTPDTEKSKPKSMSRRSFLRGGLALTTAAGVGVGAALYSGREKETQGVTETTAPQTEIEPEMESAEVLPHSESFEAERLGWQKWWELRYDQILFVDQDGAPVGEPVDFENFTVKRTRTGDNNLPEEFDYLLAPGATNENGMLKDNLASEWTRYVEARHSRDHDISTDELQQRNITEEFEQAAKRSKNEPELVESIIDAVQGGNGVETMIDMVRYYGMNPEKKVSGDKEGRTHSEYLQQEILFHNRLPKTVQDELRGFIVGLAAQESRFNPKLPKNSATAEGVMQLVDVVRKEHGFKPEQKLTFVQEVDVAGKHFSNIYKRVRYWMKHEMTDNKKIVDRPDTFTKLRNLFPEGRDGDQVWQKYFLSPCMVNAYNTGSWTIGACLHEFVDAYSEEELQEMTGENPGYDLFQKFTHFAKECDANKYTRRYGDDAQAYFPSIAGVSEGLAGV